MSKTKDKIDDVLDTAKTLASQLEPFLNLAELVFDYAEQQRHERKCREVLAVKQYTLGLSWNEIKRLNNEQTS